MIVTQIYTFTDTDNYVFPSTVIEIVGSKARLKLYDLPEIGCSESFDSDTGFYYDSNLVEFTDGKAQQKDQRPANSILGATFTDSLDANWGVDGFGDLSATSIGSPTLLDGKVVCPEGSNGIYYSDPLIGALSGDFVIKFKFIPGYTTIPATNTEIISLGPTTGTDNRFSIFHSPTGGSLRITANGLAAQVFTGWSPIAGQEYIFEVHCISNSVTLFIDNIQKGGAKVISPGQSTDAVRLYLGAGPVYNVGHGSYNDIIIYSTASQTPTYSVPEATYLETSITLPEFSYTGPGNVQAIESVSTVDAGIPRYILQPGRSGNYYYWTGSAWEISDESYSQANDITTLNTNISTFPLGEECTYAQFKICFINSNTQSKVFNLSTNITGQQYSISNPKITPNDYLFTDGLSSIIEVVNKTGSDNIKYTMSVDGVEKYWTGSAWVNTNNGYTQTNTVEEILTNIESLISLGSEVKPIIYLHSENGQTTPEIDILSISGDYAGPLPTPPTVIPVYGYVYDIYGMPLSGISVKAFLKYQYAYNSLIDISTGRKTTVTDLNGYWELNLVETTNMPEGSKYIILLEGTNYIKAIEIEVPIGQIAYNIQELI